MGDQQPPRGPWFPRFPPPRRTLTPQEARAQVAGQFRRVGGFAVILGEQTRAKIAGKLIERIRNTAGALERGVQSIVLEEQVSVALGGAVMRLAGALEGRAVANAREEAEQQALLLRAEVLQRAQQTRVGAVTAKERRAAAVAAIRYATSGGGAAAPPDPPTEAEQTPAVESGEGQEQKAGGER